MKPELKAMICAYGPFDYGNGPLFELKNIFLSSLHWRGDELWAGPVKFGEIWYGKRCWTWGPPGNGHNNAETEDKARAALLAAAKAQIETWFQEQAE